MHTVEPAIDPKNKPSFLLDWEITLRCNLDCSYCGTWGHDNTTQHPELDECLKSIDFMFEYVNIYMQQKPKWAREVVLNVYGGESIFHPNIIEVHTAIKEKYQKYKDDWYLTVHTTTNLIAGKSLINKLKELIESWTVSYHTEANAKQKEQFKQNLLDLMKNGNRVKAVILMNPHHWEDALAMVDFCKENKIPHQPRQLDDLTNRYLYSPEQVRWLNGLYNAKSHKANEVAVKNNDKVNLTNIGRACCGDRQICTNGDFQKRNYFIPNNFKGWHCSVNWFFLYVKQRTREVYHNKDCQMKFDGTVGPIGHLDNSELILDNLKNQMSTGMPVIQCAKKMCLCGICTPKASTKEHFDNMFAKYVSYSK